MKKNVQIIQLILGAAVIAIAAFVFTYLIKVRSFYPNGSDVYGHIFKYKCLYNEIKSGNYYPIYTPYWYNGIELFRYWPPLSYYFCCILMFITGGNVYDSYLLFIFTTCFVGGCGFLLFGLREKKVLLSSLLGTLYFLFPDNMRVLFSEGNIPRIFITMLLPYVFFFICEFMYYKKKYALFFINFLFVLVSFAHIMISAMLGVAAFIFILIYSLAYKKYIRGIVATIDIVIAYVVSGIILIPGLVGGIVTQNSSASVETSSSWSQKAILSLNPLLRFSDMDQFYFGLSIFFIILMGVLVMHKKTAACFMTSLIIFFGTTMIVLPILSVLPMSQVFWMIRFVPMAMTTFVIGLLYWDEIKGWMLGLFILILVVDSLVSLKLIGFSGTIDEKEARIGEEYLINEALEITDNRFALMDLSSLNSYPSYKIIQNGRDVDYLFGWSYQGAYIIKEIVELNEAFENEHYSYVFDRLVLYGCDTVVIKKDLVTGSLDDIYKYSIENGYTLIDENEKAILFKNKAINGKYGIVKNYENVCIGDGSEYITYIYPSFYKLTNDHLDEYTFEELSHYKKIYISGPSYKNYENKLYCEQLIERLSENGVKIYIDMSNLQEERSIGRESFLGVYAQPVKFNDTFPVLEKSDGSQFKISGLTKDYKEWKAVYFTNLKSTTKSAEYKKGKSLDYLGYSPNENIVFIGLNLVFYCADNPEKNSDVYDLLDEVFEEDRNDTMQMEIVPIDIKYSANHISISAKKDDIITNIANLDSFVSDKNLGKERFVSVDEGRTEISIVYAYFKESLMISIIGIIIYILYCFAIFRLYDFDRKYY